MLKSLAEYKPFVSALKSNQKALRCDHCFKSLNAKIECNTCHKYWYCSELCLIEDSTTHLFECDSNLIQIIREKCCDSSLKEESDWNKFKDSDQFVTHTLLLLRILFKRRSDPNSLTKEYSLGNGLSVSYDDISVPVSQQMHRIFNEDMCLDPEWPQMKVMDNLLYNFGAWLLVVTNILDMDIIKSKLGVIPEEVLIKAFRVVVRYTLYVCDMHFLNDIGKAIYVEMCFIEHSCLPNCAPLFQDSNVLNLRLLSEDVSEFSQLKYDFQIEMSAYSAQELSESLKIRGFDCQCIRCLNIEKSSVNYHKNVTNANLKYGNWPQFDYCSAMSVPIDETINYLVKTHGTSHPFISGLRLWKFRNEWHLFKSEELSRDELLNSLDALKNSIRVTHGSEHIWTLKLDLIENQLKQTMTDIQFIDDIIDEIIPKSVVEQKIG